MSKPLQELVAFYRSTAEVIEQNYNKLVSIDDYMQTGDLEKLEKEVPEVVDSVNETQNLEHALINKTRNFSLQIQKAIRSYVTEYETTYEKICGDEDPFSALRAKYWESKSFSEVFTYLTRRGAISQLESAEASFQHFCQNNGVTDKIPVELAQKSPFSHLSKLKETKTTVESIFKRIN